MSISESALAMLASAGMSLPPRPDFEVPTFDTDLTALPDDHLMSLFAELTAWADHLHGQVALAVSAEKEAARDSERLESAAMLAGWKTKTPVAVLKALVDVDEDVSEARKHQLVAESFRRMVSTLADNVERDAALVSRELTRRTAGHSQRSGRWFA